MDRFLRYLLIFLFALMQLAFLGAICIERFRIMETGMAMFLLLTIGLLLAFTHRRKSLHLPGTDRESLASALAVPLGTMACFMLQTQFSCGPVLAASTVGLAGSFIPGLFPGLHYWKAIPSAVYCGAFVGMSSDKVLDSGFMFLAAGCLAGLAFWVSRNLFQGVGGKLGTLAFAAVVLVVYLQKGLWPLF
jgi:hypothetical protein